MFHCNFYFTCDRSFTATTTTTVTAASILWCVGVVTCTFQSYVLQVGESVSFPVGENYCTTCGPCSASGMVCAQNFGSVTYKHFCVCFVSFAKSQACIRAQSTWVEEGSRQFCPKIMLWKLNKMPELYVTFARKNMKMPPNLSIGGAHISDRNFIKLGHRRCASKFSNDHPVNLGD